MSTGDSTDMNARLRAVLPPWFPDDNPIFNGVLSGIADGLAFGYALIQFTKLQARIATATGGWLDLIAWDYFGARFARKHLEADDTFRPRLLLELLRPRQTRLAVTEVLTDLTGVPPVIIELFNPQDCGGYDTGFFAYDTAGCWGDLTANNQILVTAYRPFGEGIANVNGYDGYAGGYDVGAIEYIDMGWIGAPVTDADIYAAVAATVAAGTTAWTAILSTPALLEDQDGSLLTDLNGALLTY